MLHVVCTVTYPVSLIFAREITKPSQATAAYNLLECFPELLTPECIDKWINDGIAHDEDEVEVKVGHETNTVRVVGAGNVENQVQEKRSPAHNKNSDQDGESDGPFHVGPLANRASSWKNSNLFDMHPSHHKHVDIEGCHENEHSEEHANKADDDNTAVRVNDEQNA